MFGESAGIAKKKDTIYILNGENFKCLPPWSALCACLHDMSFAAIRTFGHSLVDENNNDDNDDGVQSGSYIHW